MAHWIVFPDSYLKDYRNIRKSQLHCRWKRLRRGKGDPGGLFFLRHRRVAIELAKSFFGWIFFSISWIFEFYAVIYFLLII